MMNNKKWTVLLGTWLIGGALAAATPAALAETRSEACIRYAQTATSQNRTNNKSQCGYTGLRWSDDFDGQKKWCMGVRPAITKAENDARYQLLDACFAKKADVENRKHPIRVPDACSRNPEQYQPVRYLFTRQSYMEDPQVTQPVGLIDHDFNADRQSDYIFLERSPQHKFRTILCMSHASSWKRLPLYAVEENVSDYFGLGSDHVDVRNGKLYLSNGYSEHNWGSSSTVYEYSYSQQAQGFLLDTVTQSFQSGDGTQPETSEVRDYVKGEIRESVNCKTNIMEYVKEFCVHKDNVVTKMKPADYTLAKRRFK